LNMRISISQQFGCCSVFKFRIHPQAQFQNFVSEISKRNCKKYRRAAFDLNYRFELVP
jgi:hypothetical protein